jgi:putative ABC transport system substrate-binding protein
MNNRRKLIVAFGVGAIAAPLASFAQKPAAKMHRIGFLSPITAASIAGRLEAFQAGMRELGYVEGKNFTMVWRFGDGRYERLPDLALELVQQHADVIVVNGNQAISAVRKATAQIPIVMANVNDPVGSGFVASLARPGSNVTGLSSIASDISAKYLELLLSFAPKMSKVAVLTETTSGAQATILNNARAAGKKAGVSILALEARSPQEIDHAFVAMTQAKAQGLIFASNPLFTLQRRQIAELAAKHRLPSISALREFAEAGALMSYGPNFNEMYRRAATYVDKILKGAKPADLPVEQPTLFELVINGKTAKVLGLKIPYSLQIMVNKVIE